MNQDFYDDSDLQEIDQLINEQMGAPTLVDQMEKRNEKIREARQSWANEFKKHWYIYLPLMVNSIFTAMLGLYMGLAPYLRENLDGSKSMVFNTDWSHIGTAVVYVIAFLYVTEVAFAIFHYLFHTREQDNGYQHWSMMIGMFLSVIGIIGTGVSGGMVVSSTLGFLTEFQEVPASAQKWVVSVIPSMIGIHAILFAFYKLSSRIARSERMSREAEKNAELDQQMRIKQIQQIGRRRIQAASIRVFEKMVMDGLLSQSEADWALQSGLSLYEIEKKLGRDLTGDNQVGQPTRSRQRPTPQQSPVASGPAQPLYNEPAYHPAPEPQKPMQAPEPPQPNHYSAQDICEIWRKTRLEAAAIMASYNNAHHFYDYAVARTGWLPRDMTFENFAEIYKDLMGELPIDSKAPTTQRPIGNGPENP